MKKRSDSGAERFRTGGINERRDSELKGFRTRGIQERIDTGKKCSMQEGFIKGEMLDYRI